MSKQRLIVLLVPVLLLAVIYAVFTQDWLIDQGAHEEMASAESLATAAFVEETFAQPDPEELSEEEFTAIPEISPEIRLTEFPGRRLLVSGRISTGEERRVFLEAVAADVKEKFTVDNQLKLDYQCAPFAWMAAVKDLDLSVIQRIRRFDMALSNGRVELRGSVLGDDGPRVIESHFRSVLPASVTFENGLEQEARPLASLSVWASPDSTLLLSGMVPEGTAASYVQRVKEALPDMRLVSDLTEDRFVERPRWDEEIQAFLPDFLRSVQRANLSIEKGRVVHVEGLAPAASVTQLQRRVKETFPAAEFDLTVNVQVGVPTEVTVAAPTDPGRPQLPETVLEMLAVTKIYFPSGRSRVSQLEPDERAKLDRLGSLWQRENFTKKVYVFGFTDRTGDAQTNAYFSEARCRSVVSYLEKSYGIDGSYFEVRGAPEDRVPDPESPPAELRRVEFSLSEELTESPVASVTPDLPPAPRTLLKPVSVDELLAEKGEITFGSGEITPSSEDRDSLRRLGQILALERLDDILLVYGYADTKGSAEANRWYTEERCKAVARELAEGGFPEGQIVLRPVLPAQTTEGDGEGEDEGEGTNGEPEEGEASESEGEAGAPNPRRVQLVVMEREAFEASEQAMQEVPEMETETETVAEPGEDGLPEADGEVVPLEEAGEIPLEETPEVAPLEEEVPIDDVPWGAVDGDFRGEARP